ncbi:YCF48-related protein [Ichthyenterobacterium magnum]|uniref:Putative secreted protein (Por secretion system target) n=1 Tax=Ichthyenterobacterium magnum TaxID=1230530 RepID=A0A420DFB2_9FLAO|nr:YCF48-related protein [Ichthyenterobacterium magnum]RKE90886.1 putative secreted protein (Por secretion system target) [Ichthyenterobacterium magnum]
MKLIKLVLILSYLNLFAQPTWQVTPNIISNPNNQRFDDVFFLNENLGWAANGYYASVYKTTDGGLNWTEQVNEASLGGSFYFRNIEFLNQNVGFLGTLNGKFFKTIDGGSNWVEVTNISPNPTAICGLDTVGSSTIYGCGAYFTPAHIIKSTDSGNTWSFIDMSSYANALVEVLFLDETTGFVSGRNNTGGLILKTTDGGSSWTEIYNTNNPGDYVWKLQTLEGNNNIMFGSIEAAGLNTGKLIKSTDGGVNWNSYDAPERVIQAVGFITENHGWMGGHTTGFYETLDGGQTWNNLNIGHNLNRIFIINSTTAYASGTTVYKYTNETLNIETVKNTDKTHLDIKILENPIKEYLEFTINYKSDDNILIELYDVTGKFIKQLTRDIIPQNIVKAYAFDVSELSSGSYIIDFHNNSGRSIKRFIKE